MDPYEAAPGVIVIPLREVRVNAVLIHDDGEALLVDCGALPASAARIAETLDSLGTRLVGVALTHPHWDHSLGLGAADDGVPSYAHPLAIAHLESSGAADRDQVAAQLAAEGFEEEAAALAAIPVAIPTHAVGETTALTVGGLAVELEPIGYAHSPGDLVLHVRERGVTLAGDLIEVGEDPDPDGADIPAWLAALDRLAANAEPLLVPGHGEPVGHGSIAHHREFLAAHLGA